MTTSMNPPILYRIAAAFAAFGLFALASHPIMELAAQVMG